ncbi:cysteine desulfurase [Natronobacillus azotifigens]|uniref:Cysteine desulfurase family protein n=1 Tax=Natronobacillus azotifigens TaxID=472978 RepID=A0A9J6RBZ2_9BACI|nr:cysteine desulfurase family protein [Natronobacillus azotifigens]MCZ0703210.1 cysteine desulfurase family protein [Natronobacillus azotifigens]
MIYFDNSATTKPLPEVLASFQKVSQEYYGNSSSIHRFGMEADKLLRKAHQQAADLLGVKSKEIIFTSGGTEGNNLAIKGIALANQHRGKHIITSEIEHPSVLASCKALESLGFTVTYLPVDQTGVVKVKDVEEAIQKDTVLLSIMHINNELGTIQPIEEIGQLVKDLPTTYFHVDDVQGFGKTKLKLENSGIDLYTISGHKIHGLKGTGLLYVKEGINLFPLFHGGTQQMNYRSGTENLAGAVSFVKAMRLIVEHQKNHQDYLVDLHEQLRKELTVIPEVKINTIEGQAPHILNFSIPGYKPEVILHALEERNIFLSTKSACSSKKSVDSAVLKAINLPRDRTRSALRISLSYQNTAGEIELFSRSLKKVIKKLSQTMG